MIEDSYIYHEFKKFESEFKNSPGSTSLPLIRAQLPLGITAKKWKDQKYPAACDRHKLLLQTHFVIPRYCFDCYKVEIHTGTVLEFFKLMFVFNDLNLENNNHRKLWLQAAKNKPENYIGTIYFQSLAEAITVSENIRPIIDNEVSPDVPIKVKRGCSEFNHILPKYHDIKESYDSLVSDKNKWREIEFNFDRNNVASKLPAIKSDTNPSIDNFNIKHFNVMHTWLKFARSIGENTYLKVTKSSLDEMNSQGSTG